MQKINFLKTAIKDYKVGAITKSSKYAVQRIVAEIPSKCKYIVEYGAGSGAITQEILQNMPIDGKLIAIELNQIFIGELKKINDQRLKVIGGDVMNVIKDISKISLHRIEIVVSGIPFTFIKPMARQKIVQNTHKMLADNGIFLVYQYSPLILPILKNYFSEVKNIFEIKNFPPYFIMRAKK